MPKAAKAEKSRDIAQAIREHSRQRRWRPPLYLSSALLGLAACHSSQPASSPTPIAVDEATVYDHRLSPVAPLRLSETEWNQLQTGRCGGGNYLPYELTISTSGSVEAAHLLPYQSFCNSTPTPAAPGPVVTAHLQEADSLVRAQRFTPWVVNGHPAPVLIHTSLAITPPEHFGPSRSFPANVDPATVSLGLERRGCEGTLPCVLRQSCSRRHRQPTKDSLMLRFPASTMPTFRLRL